VLEYNECGGGHNTMEHFDSWKYKLNISRQFISNLFLTKLGGNIGTSLDKREKHISFITPDGGLK
jgi:hypothetical protein